MDQDYLQSWLRTYEEAKMTQEGFQRRQADAAKNFFKPRSATTTPYQTTALMPRVPPTRNVDLESLSGTSDSSYSESVSSAEADDSITLISDFDYSTDASVSDISLITPTIGIESSDGDASMDTELLPVFSANV